MSNNRKMEKINYSYKIITHRRGGTFGYVLVGYYSREVILKSYHRRVKREKRKNGRKSTVG
jgi:hypothetical protein